jgi:succinate dehydrogenase/fumarate reductase flavoprotein subunit
MVDVAHAARVIGAAGIDCHMGAFVVVQAKAVTLAANRPQRIFPRHVARADYDSCLVLARAI